MLSTPDWELHRALGVGDGGMRNFGSADSSTGSVTSEAACFRCALLPCTGEGGTRGVRLAASSMARCNAARLVMAVPLVGRNPVSVAAASLSEDSTSMVALGFGARLLCFCGVGGGVSSPLSLLLVLARLAFFLLHRLESGAVSLLDDDGVCLEYSKGKCVGGKRKEFLRFAAGVEFPVVPVVPVRELAAFGP